MSLSKQKYSALIDSIGAALQKAKENAVKAVNTELVKANWLIGKYIVEYEQQGKGRAEYGTELLVSLSKDLKLRFGKGFSRSNLQLMRLFYVKYPDFPTQFEPYEIRQTLSGKSEKSQTLPGILSWSHYAELLTVSDDLARAFYEKQAIKENWSFREMKRQIDSALFQRLALSKDKKGILALAEKGQEIVSANDAIKDPYIFEFLELPINSIIKERAEAYFPLIASFIIVSGKYFPLNPCF